MSLDSLAKRYVQLTLALGEHHPHYIDAYYGPEDWRPTENMAVEQLESQIACLCTQLTEYSAPDDEQLRLHFLQVQARAMNAFLQLVKGMPMPFDEESIHLYDAVSPQINELQLDITLEKLADALPGSGPLNERFSHFVEQFVIPKDKLDAVFSAAVDESRRRTKQYIALDDNESFSIEYVTDKVWSGYNWYQGNNYSLIQMNTDFPIYIARAVDLAAHEGYPGHHVFNSLMEKHLVNHKGWYEYSVYPLFSPMSLLAEGSANYGIEVVFPRAERIQFEKNVLFPLAGLDTDLAEHYYLVQDLVQELSYADNMVAKRYLDGAINREEAIALLVKYTLVSHDKATQRLGFIEANRAYVINYNLGQDIVKAYIEKQVPSRDPIKIWQCFTHLLANPKTASMMQ